MTAQAAFSLTRTSSAYRRVRTAAERLADRLLNECRDTEAQALLDLLASHEGQRKMLVQYHQSLQRALHGQRSDG